MSNEIVKSFRIWVSTLISGILIITIGGCISRQTNTSKKPALEKIAPAKHITGIHTAESTGAVHVKIQADQLLTYTVLKKPSPRAVILYFPDTRFDLSPFKGSINSKVIGHVITTELTEKGHTAQIEIPLKQDLPYETVRQGTNLIVVFNKHAQPESKIKTSHVEVTPLQEEKKEMGSGGRNTGLISPDVNPQPLPNPATRLQSVTSEAGIREVKIRIIADGMIKNYKSFTLDKPPRIVIDLFNIKSPFNKPMRLPVDTRWVKRVRHFYDAKKLRIVLETPKKYLSSFSLTPVHQGLLISVGEDVTVSDTPGNQIGKIENFDKKPKAAAITVVPIQLERMDLLQEDTGRSTVIIGANRPITYDIQKITATQLRIRLNNVDIPKHLNHPLMTDTPMGVVARISPQKPSGSGKAALIIIDLKKPVPYYVNLAENTMRIEFEDTPLVQNTPETIEKTTKIPDPVQSLISEPKKSTADLTNRQRVEDSKPEYTGAKIALDFYDTDIKNVFRLIGDISKENFAIDKDVSGKVTLALDKPVPWDQVLDLVLKMNKLGKHQEGNIIRIATLATLKAEGDRKTAELKARRAAEKQADLVTEYITVNYADAERDIKHHIEAVLTKNIDGSNRGTLSVDKRNNIIILTDIPVTIKRAVDIVKKLDRVTPQVIIEARIVEANTKFSRDLGIHWSTETGIKKTDVRAGIGPQRGFDRFGGTWGYNTAINAPTANAANAIFGLNITKIAGTPFLLDAYLHAMEEEDQGRIVSSPRVLTLDNQEATISQGLEWPYLELSKEGTPGIKFKKIALELKVTPHITQDLRVAMEVAIKKSDVAGVKLLQGTEAPYMSLKETKTKLLVNDNDTIVIGGIVKTSDTDTKTGLPWLSKIPILGWLFKTQKKIRDKEELLVFITPKIVQLEQRDINNISKQ